MKLGNIITVIVALLVFGLAALNWDTFMHPLRLNFLVGASELPFGLSLLVLFAIVSLFYLVRLAQIEISARSRYQRILEELAQARKLTEQEELSRVAGLRTFLDSEITQIELKLDMLLEERGIAVPEGGKLQPGRD